jgi:hypothetical protein
MRDRLTVLLVAVLGAMLVAAPVIAQEPPDDTQSYGELLDDGAEVGVFQPGTVSNSGSGGSRRTIRCTLDRETLDGPMQTSYAELQRMYETGGNPITVTRRCTELPANFLPDEVIDWTPADGDPVSPEALAQLARSRLQVPTPSGDVSPSIGVGTQAQMATYFWLDNWPAVGAGPSASASAGGVTVTATATPVSHTWWIRDSVRGTFPVRCGAGPGAAYSGTGAPPAGACVWTPQHSSAGQSSTHSVTGEPCFAATVTVVWNVAWSGGDLGNLATHANTCIVVHEIQAVVSGS